MKQLIYLILILLLTGCTAQWHLQRAIKKEPGIIDVQADTIVSIDTSFIDTTFVMMVDTTIIVNSDTAIIDTNVINCQNATLEAHSTDGIAHARAELFNNNLSLRTWATLDTVVTLRDSIKYQVATINRLERINRQNKAVIKEKKRAADKILTWLKIAGIALGALIVGIIVIKII